MTTNEATDPVRHEAAKRATLRVHQSMPVLAHMGVRVVEIRSGFVVAEAPFDGNGNHLGTMYAGVLFSVGEVLGGLIAMSTFDARRYAPVVKAMQIDFRRPARGAVRATAMLDEDTAASTMHAADASGRADYVLTADITDADGALVAVTTGTYLLRTIEARPSPT